MQEVIMITMSKDELSDMIASHISSAIESLPRPQEKTNRSEENLTIKQLAVYLNCSVCTIHNYKSRNVIPYYQTGRKIYFKKSEVDQALAANEMFNHKKSK